MSWSRVDVKAYGMSSALYKTIIINYNAPLCANANALPNEITIVCTVNLFDP